MPKLKSHKTVEQIAKKHRMDVSFIQKQLDMGKPIELEHTKDHTLAMDIALQHLDEIPDYYTRLKKMEASAKKEHKKFKDVNIDEANSLHHWYSGSESEDGTPGWVQSDGSPCANEPGETKTPKCFSSARLAALKRKGKKGESLIRSAVNRKREKDSGQQQKSGAAKPTNVPTFAKGRKSKDYVEPEPQLKETMEIQEAQKDNPSKGAGTKDACYTKVKSRYDVWPSAYASGALVKCRKVGADNWGNKTEAVEEQRYCPLCNKREGRSVCSYGGKAWDKVSVKDHEYSMVRSELDTLIKAAERIKKKVGKGEGSLEAWVQSKITKAADYIDTAADYLGSDEKIDEGSQISFNVDPQQLKADKTASKIRTLAQQGATKGERTAAQNKTTGPSLAKGSLSTGVINAEYEPSLVEKILAELEEEKKGYPKTLDIDEDLAQARKNVGASKCWPGKVAKGTKMEGGKEVPNCESVTIEDANGKLYAEVIDLIKPEPMVSPKSTFMTNNELDEATRLQSETGNIIAVILSWRGKTYSIRMFFPQVNMPSKKDVTTEIQKVYPTAIVVQYNVSTLQPGMPLIQVVNSKSKNYLLNNATIGEETIEEEGPVLSVGRGEKLPVSKGAGLTAKGRKKYNNETGSNLQAPVTGKVKPGSKAAKRRKNFCARSRSWDGERGLAARARWKC